jgi:hypothetical protein
MTTKEKTNSNRKAAIAVGALYIAATVAGVLSVAPITFLTNGPGMLAQIAANEGKMITAVSLEFIMALTVAGVAFMIYPILKQDTDTDVKKGLASWYLGSRITEGAIFVVAILARLLLLVLSQEFLKAGSPDVSYFQTGGTVLVAASNYAYMLGQSVFCVGAAMLYYLLYQSKRVPRWLSVWGFIGAPLMLAAGFLVLVDGNPNSPLSTAMYAPMALQEMVFAVWLIVKGFNPSTK